MTSIREGKIHVQYVGLYSAVKEGASIFLKAEVGSL